MENIVRKPVKLQIAKCFVPVIEAIQDKTTRHIIITGGRAKGASTIGHQIPVLDIVQHPSHNWIISRKVKETLKDSVHAQTRAEIVRMELDDWFFYSDKQATPITYIPTGQQIISKGGDDVRKIFKSIKLKTGYIKGILFEEADQYSNEKDFSIARNSVMRGVPEGMEGNFKFLYISNRKQTKDDWFNVWVDEMALRDDVLHININYLMLPKSWVEPEFHKEMEIVKKMNPKYYEYDVLGIPNISGGEETFMDADFTPALIDISPHQELKYVPLEYFEEIINKNTRIDFGIDVARFGNDKTEIYGVVDYFTVYHHEIDRSDLMTIVNKISHVIMEIREVYPNIEEIYIKVDDTGVGGGVTDRLKELTWIDPHMDILTIIPVNNGEKVDNTNLQAQLLNKGTETWYELNALIAGNAASVAEGGRQIVGIPKDHDMIQQFKNRRKKFTSSKMRLENKSEYKKRTGYSPDKADALALAYYRPTSY